MEETHTAKGKIKRFLRRNILFEIILAVVLVNIFVISIIATSGRSMEPTIPDSSYVLVRKAGYTPVRNDVVVAWNGEYCIVKRVIGMPGETICIEKDGTITIDGKTYDDAFSDPYTDDADAEYVGTPVTLRDDEYFLIGDNRADSRDSRYIGPIKGSCIIGKVIHIWKR